MAKPRLTKPQQILLDEMKESSTGGLWIDLYGRYYRTANALWVKGYVTRDPHSQMSKRWFEPVKDDNE